MALVVAGLNNQLGGKPRAGLSGALELSIELLDVVEPMGAGAETLCFVDNWAMEGLGAS
jgi:hypothetical protein